MVTSSPETELTAHCSGFRSNSGVGIHVDGYSNPHWFTFKQGRHSQRGAKHGGESNGAHGDGRVDFDDELE
jgi:hypothetical protein